MPLEGSVPGDPIGRVMLRADAAAGSCARDTNDAKVIFKAEARLPTGYTILTSYPILTHRPADIDETCPCLFQLIGGYFHQDWYDEFGGSPQAALEAYVAASTSSELGETAAEIDVLLAANRDDALAQIFIRFDNNYLYEEDAGSTARAGRVHGWV